MKSKCNESSVRRFLCTECGSLHPFHNIWIVELIGFVEIPQNMKTAVSETMRLVQVENRGGLDEAVGLEIRGGTKGLFIGQIGHKRRTKDNSRSLILCC